MADRFTTPKKVRPSEIPKKKAPRPFKEALRKVSATPGYRATMAKARKAEQANAASIHKSVLAEMAKLKKQARQGAKVDFRRIQAACNKHYKKARLQQLDAHYKLVAAGQRTRRGWAHIDRIECGYSGNIWKGAMRPGLPYHLYGTGFGPYAGTAFMRLADNHVVELRVGTWTDTKVIVRVDQDLEGVVPCDSLVWVKDSQGVKSTSFAIPFRPVYRRHYWWHYGPDIWGAPAGKKKNGKICPGQVLRQGCRIEKVFVQGIGSGWGEARAPHASGTSLAQGYHLAASAVEHASLVVTYYLFGPKGVDHSVPGCIDSTATDPWDLSLSEF